MYVKTKVAISNIHGLGVFADQFIPAGTTIWKYTPGFDQKFTRNQILRLPKTAQIYLAVYAYLSKKSGLYVFPVDNGKYFNHSETPNTYSHYHHGEGEVVTRAVTDIWLGDELTDNYSSFEALDDGNNLLEEIISRYELSDERDPRLKSSGTVAAF